MRRSDQHAAIASRARELTDGAPAEQAEHISTQGAAHAWHSSAGRSRSDAQPPDELRGFLAAFDPAIAKLFYAARRAVLAAAPGSNERVYDACNAVGAAYTFSDRLAEAFCHVAADPRYVNLGFDGGAALPDPDGVRVGKGARMSGRPVGRTARFPCAALSLEPVLDRRLLRGRRWTSFERRRAMEHKVIHFEIQGRDGKRTQEFYQSLFGWTIDANNPMQYGIVSPESGGIGGGICQAMGPPMVTFYVSAPDLAAALKKAERLGGKTVLEPQQVPNGPEIALFSDPDGNVVGLVKQGSM